MKSVAIVTNHRTSTLGPFLRKNLEMVLSGFITIRSYYLDDLTPGYRIPDDVIVTTTRDKAIEVKGWVDDARKIISVNRTIRTTEIYRICSIPANARVLVVNDNHETTVDFMTLLYKLGIDHLDMIPFDPNMDYPDVHIAITPGERVHVPKHIGTVIDTGHRFIDISTFIQIIDMLGLTDAEIQKRLYRYSDDLVPLESGINSQYRQLYTRNLELDSIMNVSHEGILLVNTAGIISLHNRALTVMLETEPDIVGSSLESKVQEPLRLLLRQERIDNELVQYREHTLLVTSRGMEHFGQRSGTYFNFQDITYIRQLEQNLSRKLLGIGFLPQYTFDDVLTESPTVRRRIQLATKFAASDLPIFISGESGTGKELFAHSIHSVSSRRGRPFVAFNCAAVPESLVESELFGYEAGAFTGALKSGKPGLFEQANNGTIFLDEIGDMPYILQSKILRVLQERQVMRIGSQKLIPVNIRVISATNQDLEQRIRSGQFREDLYYRLNVLPLHIPALRERPEDILYLFAEFQKVTNRVALPVSDDARAVLLGYSWPGNVRELWNVAAYASFIAEHAIGVEALPEYIATRLRDYSPLARRLDGDGLGATRLAVLRMIAQSVSDGSGVGRASIQHRLEKQGAGMTEARVRGIMALLQKEGLIESGAGRSGTRVTSMGQAFINWSENRRIFQPDAPKK
ncbi:MAG TPA: sigma 54-interacting transcriptional regulator [bacterium]|nr:sigma 54-interacting transcriptional regulator [bacterium]